MTDPAPDADVTPALSGVSDGVDQIRGTMKWVLGTFGAVGTAALAKLTLFTDVGALNSRDATLAAWSLAAAVLGFALVIVRAAYLYRQFQPSLQWLQGRERQGIRKRIEADASVLGGFDSVEALATAIHDLFKKQLDSELTDAEQTRLGDALDAQNAVLAQAAFQWAFRRFNTTMVAVVFGILAISMGMWGYVFATSRDSVENPGASHRPSLTAQLTTTPSSAITGSVKATGVYRKDTLTLRVDGKAGKSKVVLYRVLIGADKDGKIDSSFAVPLGFVDFDSVVVKAWLGTQAANCNGDAVDTHGKPVAKSQPPLSACLVLHLPGVSRRPRLTTSWDTSNASIPVLHFHAASDSFSTASRLELAIVAESSAHSLVYSTAVGPDATGKLDVNSTLPVRGGEDRVCVIAREVNRSTTGPMRSNTSALVACPGGDSPTTAWANLTVPR